MAVMFFVRPNSKDAIIESRRLKPGTCEVKIVQPPASCKAATGPAANKNFAWVLLIIVAAYSVAWSSVDSLERANPAHHSLFRSEHSLRHVPAHISEFGPASAPLALPRCGNVRPPEALLTPDPLLPVAEDSLLVRVSFIVGSDGHVYSAFVLNSAGPDEDQAVLRTVRQWRYRPALCNGVPTDFEARVRFSIP